MTVFGPIKSDIFICLRTSRLPKYHFSLYIIIILYLLLALLPRDGGYYATNGIIDGRRRLLLLGIQYLNWALFLLFEMASLATAELCDAHTSLIANGELRVIHPIFKIYGQRHVFSGPVVTLKVFEDNVLVRALLETPGDGRVLVIDGGGSLRCALVGGNLGQLAQSMGWAGIVVNGCIRDVDEINGCDIGVRALGPHPRKSYKKGVGEKFEAVDIGGTLITTGEWLYADSDGILVSRSELSV